MATQKFRWYTHRSSRNTTKELTLTLEVPGSSHLNVPTKSRLRANTSVWLRRFRYASSLRFRSQKQLLFHFGTSNLNPVGSVPNSHKNIFLQKTHFGGSDTTPIKTAEPTLAVGKTHWTALEVLDRNSLVVSTRLKVQMKNVYRKMFLSICLQMNCTKNIVLWKKRVKEMPKKAGLWKYVAHTILKETPYLDIITIFFCCPFVKMTTCFFVVYTLNFV